jgi:hypothetical protein
MVRLSLLTLGIYAATSACGGPSRRESQLDVDPGTLREMQGTWRWLRSTGGPLDGRVSPRSSELRYTLDLMASQQYREASSTGDVFVGTYSVTRGSTFDRPSASVPIVQSSRPLFNAYFNPGREYAVVVRADTLKLSEASNHSWVHVYVRATHVGSLKSVAVAL